MMTEHFRTMVPGAKATGAVKEVHSPYDGAVVGSVDLADFATVDTALATAHALFRDRSAVARPRAAHRDPAPRRRADGGAGRGAGARAAREGGKPLADSRVEVRRAIDGVRSCVDLLRTEAGTCDPDGHQRGVRGARGVHASTSPSAWWSR